MQGLQKSYKELPVLCGVGFDVARGSIFALLGSDGAGKTTVVRILSTLLTAELLEQAPDRGELDRQDEQMGDEAFIRLMDSFANASHPAVARLRELIAEHGWTGWTRMEGASPEVPQQPRHPRRRSMLRLPRLGLGTDHTW